MTLTDAGSISSVVNLRDVGGHATRTGGRVRTGLLYRSAELDHVSETDAPELARLGIRAVYDLRTEEERLARPDRLPPGAAYRVVDVLEDAAGDSPAAVMRKFADAKAASEEFGGDRGIAFFVRAYRNFVLLDSARRAYRRVFSDLTTPTNRPALMHCTTGKDRTGWATAALLMLLDVPDEVVMEDFLASTRHLGPALQPVLDEFESRGGDPGVLRTLVGVYPEYLETAVAEVGRVFGTVDDYFAEGLGIDADAQRLLRSAFVEAR